MLRTFAIGLLVVTGLGAAIVWAVWPENWTVNAPITNSLFGWGIETPPQSELEKRLDLPEGTRLSIYAENLGQARILKFTSAGDLLVSVPRTGSVMLIARDADGDGRGDEIRTLVSDLNRPHGLEIVGDHLYVGETDAIVRFPFDAESGAVTDAGERIVTGLPGGGNHWTRTVRQGPDGKLYVGVGSTCNVCIEEDPRRASIVRFALDGSEQEIFADGLRNTLGYDWHPETGELWGGDNGRDLLGDHTPVEELNRIVEGGFYGWPFFYGNNVPDPDFGDHQDPRLQRAIPPELGFPAHMAPVSLKFVDEPQAPESLQGAALLGFHGSWNRSTKVGYLVARIDFATDGAPSWSPYISGFEKDGDVIGRPVDTAFGPDGALYISDDYAGAVYRVSYDGSVATPVATESETPATDAQAVAANDVDVAAGKQLYLKTGCVTCHGAGPEARAVVPLRNLSRYSPDEIAGILTAPPGNMPAYKLSESDMGALAAYLRSAYP